MLNKEKLLGAGFDYQAAIKRFAGKEALYEKYLYRFDEDNHYEKANKAFQEGDYKTILSEVHTLKGIVGTLGMTSLFNACQAVVVAIRGCEYDKLEHLFAILKEEYEKTKDILTD